MSKPAKPYMPKTMPHLLPENIRLCGGKEPNCMCIGNWAHTVTGGGDIYQWFYGQELTHPFALALRRAYKRRGLWVGSIARSNDYTTKENNAAVWNAACRYMGYNYTSPRAVWAAELPLAA